jgi:hypothetical protein
MATQPTHTIHSADEPLPVSGERNNVDYSADNVARLADQEDKYPAAQRNAATTTHHHTHSPSHIPTTDKANLNRDLGPQQGAAENRFDPTRTTDDDANRGLSSQQGAEYPTKTRRGENKSDIPTRTTDDAGRGLSSQQGAEHPKETHLGESRFDERPGLSGGDTTSNAPHAKPGIKDKIIGKTEEVKYPLEFSQITCTQTQASLRGR